MLDDAALDCLFRSARTHRKWQQRPLDDATLHTLYDLLKWAPTSANSSPARFVFVRSPAEKERLLACLDEGNRAQTRAAPVTAIVAMDLAFYEQLAQLAPHTDARSWFAGNEPLIELTALRNSSLQGAYLMLAARALGLAVGPMSGFDGAAVNRAFFDGTTYRVNFLCNLGYADEPAIRPRAPRLTFEQACRIV